MWFLGGAGVSAKIVLADICSGIGAKNDITHRYVDFSHLENPSYSASEKSHFLAKSKPKMVLPTGNSIFQIWTPVVSCKRKITFSSGTLRIAVGGLSRQLPGLSPYSCLEALDRCGPLISKGGFFERIPGQFLPACFFSKLDSKFE